MQIRHLLLLCILYTPPQRKYRSSLWLAKCTVPAIPPDPHHVLVITLGVTLPKSQSQMTILLFSDKTSYLQNGCTLSNSINSFSMRTGALGQRMTLCAIGSQGKSCTTFTISKVRSRSCTHIACSHICCHRNAKECAETAGYSIMSDMSHM